MAKRTSEERLKNTPYGIQMAELERGLIRSALEVSDGSWSEAACRLGVPSIFLRRRGTWLGMYTPRRYRAGRRSRSRAALAEADELLRLAEEAIASQPAVLPEDWAETLAKSICDSADRDDAAVSDLPGTGET